MADEKSFQDRYIAQNGDLVHKIKAKDATGRWAYYFVLIPPHKEGIFDSKIGKPGMIDLTDYGTIIASCYGEAPTEAVKKLLKDKYDFDV